MHELSEMFLYNPIYWIVIFSLLILCIVLKVFTPKILGWFGEYWVKQQLNKLPKDKYKIINNVLISVDGITHQIDHIIVSPYGIFSIETKQYNGYITGAKYDKHWVRHLGKKKLYYTNPIRQNYGHVKALSELLNIDESKVFNIVCIPSKAKLRIKHDGELTRNYDIVDKIKSYQNTIINNVDEISNEIIIGNITDKKIVKEHINNIKNNVNFDGNICPKCGGELVERKGKYGTFIGCSNYPKCKYIKKQ